MSSGFQWEDLYPFANSIFMLVIICWHVFSITKESSLNRAGSDKNRSRRSWL